MSPVRSLGPEDVARMAALHARCFDRPWSANDFTLLMATPGAATLAVEDEGGLAGFILAQAMGETAEILTLAVDPARRRQGLGAALVEAAAAVLSLTGAGELWLEVAEDNPGALALYASVGFETTGRRRAYYHRGDRRVDALLMRRRLNTAERSA